MSSLSESILNFQKLRKLVQVTLSKERVVSLGVWEGTMAAGGINFF